MDRNGNRIKRDQLYNRRVPALGYYIIVTDTKETEHHYLHGLRDSIPKELQGRLVIKVSKAKTIDMVDEANRQASLLPQYSEPWIVFDRDQVDDFDQIISASENIGIRVGWSNPCIEIWFNAYFGSMPNYSDSVRCCREFASVFRNATCQKYIKSDSKIYSKLQSFGNEQNAIAIAKQKISQHHRNCICTPSKMSPCSTLHELVNEIREKSTSEK